MKYRDLLFDLDGTIMDSAEGITKSVQYSLRKFGIDEEDLSKLTPFVGPPLLDSYEEFYGMDEKQAMQAVAYYRERYEKTGLFECSPYEGIASLLERLQKEGRRLIVASSKPEVFVRRILEHFDLARAFDAIIGPDPYDPSNQKSVLIKRALDALGLKACDVIMAGDSRYDIIGAKEAGCASIGVTYGYGTREELIENGADYLVDAPLEMKKILNL